MCLKEFYTYMLIFPYKLCETIGRIYRMQLIFDFNGMPCCISSEISLFHWSKESSVHKRMYYHGLYTKCNLLLFAIGGIECNPGPRSIKYPCGSCNRNAVQNILFIMWFAPGFCLLSWTISRTYPWSFVKHIFRKTFEAMTSTYNHLEPLIQ
jgi:hypothetical protein